MAVFTKSGDKLLCHMQNGNAVVLGGVLAGGTAGADPLKRGTVLGRVTATGRLVPVDKSKTDGSEKIWGILLADADIAGQATNGVRAPVLRQGVVNIDALIFTVSGNTAADYEVAANEIGIRFDKNVPA